jgi:hypothetical protein
MALFFDAERSQIEARADLPLLRKCLMIQYVTKRDFAGAKLANPLL